MGAGVSHQPVYLTRSTMLISHSPAPPSTQHQTAQVRRPSVHQGGISSQIAMPLQFYPNNVYQNSGYAAQVQGFQAYPNPDASARLPPLNIATPQYSSFNPNNSNSSSNNNNPPQAPSAPNEEHPPPYTSIYPTVSMR